MEQTPQKENPTGQSGAGKVIYIHQCKPVPQKAQERYEPFSCRIEKIHAHGPRMIEALLLEIADMTQRPYSIGHLVNRYATLPPDTLRQLGADRMPQLPPGIQP